MKFQVNQFWWTRNKVYLMKITKVYEDNSISAKLAGNLKATNVSYDRRGFRQIQKPRPTDLVQQETNARVIAKYLWKKKDEARKRS